jgi:ankyrin repeat protein
VIWLASSLGTVDQLKMLLEHSIIGIDQKFGSLEATALQQAIANEQLDNVKILLEYGADPNN